MTKYQSVDYKFPKKAWISAIWLTASNPDIIPFYLPIVRNTQKEAIKYSEVIIKEVRAEPTRPEVLDKIMLIPIYFSSLFPLKKEYWEDPYMPKEGLDKITSFSKAFLHPNFYKIMITPTVYKEKMKDVFLTAAFVFTEEEAKYLEEMTKASSHPVASQYKNSAIYDIGEMFAYDLIKKKVSVQKKILQN